MRTPDPITNRCSWRPESGATELKRDVPIMKKLIVISSIIVCLCFAFPTFTNATSEDEIVKNTSYLINLAFIADWSSRAMQAYKEEKPEIAIWALKNLVDLLSKQYQMSADGERYDFLETDLILAYGRLALSFKATGNIQQYQHNISESLELARKRYKQEIQSEQVLLLFIKRADEIGQKPNNKVYNKSLQLTP